MEVLKLLIAVASLVAEHRELRLSSFGARA